MGSMGYTGIMSGADKIAQALTGPYPKSPLEEHLELHREMMRGLGMQPDPLTEAEIRYVHSSG